MTASTSDELKEPTQSEHPARTIAGCEAVIAGSSRGLVLAPPAAGGSARRGPGRAARLAAGDDVDFILNNADRALLHRPCAHARERCGARQRRRWGGGDQRGGGRGVPRERVAVFGAFEFNKTTPSAIFTALAHYRERFGAACGFAFSQRLPSCVAPGHHVHADKRSLRYFHSYSVAWVAPSASTSYSKGRPGCSVWPRPATRSARRPRRGS